MIIIQEVLYMVVRMTRKDRFKGLNDIDKTLESMESLSELINLYKGNIQYNLNKLTDSNILQAQIKHELGIDW
jgi:hypothetical protein